ncbi:MAG: UDP-2,3-diacylglucosamine diphosphatase LpxI [Nitrospirae bacterium]|nr:UDP-2,3-diacylglucosamine diphosphatase LpxI [Nitrospirota bacterium]
MKAKIIGIIAGNGQFPLLIAQAIRQRGHSVVAIAHEGLTDPQIEQSAKTLWVKVGQLGSLIRGLKDSGVREVVMAGGFRKTLLFSNIRPDMRAISLLARIRSKEDDVILRALAGELEAEGIRVSEATGYLKDLLAPSGVLSRREPTAEEWKDIRFGWRMAKEVGRLDIGQCLVVKEQAVLAVEAIEGTDEAIRRGGRLGGSGSVVIKICKPGQDTRFDLPTVGIQTLEAMKEVGAHVLAVESGRTVMIDLKKMSREADAADISIVGVDETNEKR